jgi:hypothetical protein
MTKKPIKKTINIKSPWVDISQALPLFDDATKLMRAAYDGLLETRGRRFDDFFHGENLERTPIEKGCWDANQFDVKSLKLSGTYETDFAPIEYHYYDIEVSRNDLMNLIAVNNSAYQMHGNTELKQAIIMVFLDVVRENNWNLPSAAQVWRSLEKRMSEFKCVVSMQLEKDEGVIQWKNLDGLPQKPHAFNTFENLITDLKKPIKKLV